MIILGGRSDLESNQTNIDLVSGISFSSLSDILGALQCLLKIQRSYTISNRQNQHDSNCQYQGMDLCINQCSQQYSGWTLVLVIFDMIRWDNCHKMHNELHQMTIAYDK